MAADPLLLKKYPNRRLYDTEQSRYITLNDLADIIKSGRRVKVIDVRTEADVTAFVLTQIIMEQAKNSGAALPASVLHLFIQHGETTLNDFFDNYLEKALTGYLAYRRSMDAQFDRFLDLGMDLGRMTRDTLDGMAPFSGLWPPAPNEPEPKDDQE
jgi:polyhydroxyalkanoate synthesis repressor PhaR